MSSGTPEPSPTAESSRVARALTKNLALLYAGDMVAKVLATAAFVLLWRRLGPAAYGDLEFAIGIWFVLNLVQEAGLEPYGGREIAKHPDQAARLATVVMACRAILSLLGIGLLLGLVAWLAGPPFAKPRSALLVTSLYALALAPAPFLVHFVFQARDEMSVVSLSAIVRQLVLVLGVVVVVQGPEDVFWVPVFDACAIGVVALGHQWLFRRRVGRWDVRELRGRMRLVVGEALPLAISSGLWATRIYAPLLSLYVFAGSEAAGVFGAGHRLVLSGHVLVWLYFFNLLPSLSRAAASPDRAAYRALIGSSLRIVAWLALLGSAVLTALSTWIIPTLGGAAYLSAAEPFSIQVWMLAFAAVSGHMRYALIAFGKQKQELGASIAGALVAVGGTSSLALGVGGFSLTPTTAAVVFVAAEAMTFLAANAWLSCAVEPIGLVRGVARPTCVLAGLGTAAWASGASAWVSAVGLIVGTIVAVAVWDRSLLRDAKGLLERRRG